MKHSRVLPEMLLSSVLLVGVVSAQAPGAAAGQANAAPVEASKGYKLHLDAATAVANTGMTKSLLHTLCTVPQPGRSPDPPPVPKNPIEPAKAFDNLFFVGTNVVSAWALETSAGTILIDALNNAKEAKEVIVPGMKKLGLDPKEIKYVIITHGHGDHYGGAQYLVDQFHPRVISSEADWKMMEGPPAFENPNWDAPPKRDMTIGDGATLTLGDTTVTMYLTPGHTPGTISVILPVRDNGVRHTAALWGGTAFNFEPAVATFRMYGDSAEHFRKATRQAAVDVMLSNHPAYDETQLKLPATKVRKVGEPNPFVVGAEVVDSFLTVLGECARARMEAMQ